MGADERPFGKSCGSEIPAVGVCVNLPVEEVAAHLKEGLIQIAQLHGTEDEAYMEMLQEPGTWMRDLESM